MNRLGNIKDKTVKGLFWSLIDSAFGQGLQFIFGIILARMLSPREFGLIGMLTLFIILSETIVQSGFTTALIRKTDCTDDDYSTVFIFNVFISFLLYGILFFGSNSIATFYNEPQLEILLKVLGISVIINAFSLVQKSILTKNINFKLQTKISIIASFTSGVISIWMAVNGYGVWSLVSWALTRFLFTTIFLWFFVKWKPSLVFSKSSFTELFSFGSKLLISGLLNTTSTNIYHLIIGKYFSVIHLGYYTRAKQFTDLPSNNLNSIIGRVTFPVLSTIQHDKVVFKDKYKKIVTSSMFISFILMFGLAAVAEPLVITLIGEKWRPIIIYLQLLCFAGSLYPLHSLNLSILKIYGRSDLFLRLEIIKIFLIIPFVYFGIKYGLTYLIVGQLMTSIIAFFLNSYWSKTLISYSSWNQLMNIAPSFLLAILVSGIMYIVGFAINTSPILTLCIQLTGGTLLVLIIGEITKFNEYKYIKTSFLQYINV